MKNPIVVILFLAACGGQIDEGSETAEDLVSGTTIAVGPHRSVKDLKSIKDGNVYVLDPGTYSLSTIYAHSISISSSDPNNPATVEFLNAPTINCYGKCVLKNINITGSENMIALGSQPGSKVLAQDITMDGGAIFAGSGGDIVELIRVQSTGRPNANNYFISNFDHPLEYLYVDLTGMLPVQQGHGQAAIRLMDIVHSQLIGVTTTPWLYDGKNIWKQDVQARPDSTLEEFINCHFGKVDIGDMTWRHPAHDIQEVRFINSILDFQPELTDGHHKVTYQDTSVEGNMPDPRPAPVPEPESF